VGQGTQCRRLAFRRLRYWAPTSVSKALEVSRAIGLPLVVKADGLAPARGHVPTAWRDDPARPLRTFLMAAFTSPALVLEERLKRPEVSVFALTEWPQRWCCSRRPGSTKEIVKEIRVRNTWAHGRLCPAPLLDGRWPGEGAFSWCSSPLEGVKGRGASTIAASSSAWADAPPPMASSESNSIAGFGDP